MKPCTLRKARASRRESRRDRGGMALVLVLSVVAFLSLSAYTFTRLMFAERKGAWIHGRALQAEALADSGIEWLKQYALTDPATLQENGGLYDNSAQFQAVTVKEDASPRDRGRFTVISPGMDDMGVVGGIRYGLEDESTRLNLNTVLAADALSAGRDILMKLPGMTEETADAILDWLDEDDEPRELGAEIDYYTSLDPPYEPRNGPLHSVEELLLVRGVTPGLLFGADANRNWGIDDDEPLADSIDGVDNSDGSLNHGWSAYLTLYSAEANIRADGSDKIDLNQSDLQTLHDQLKEVMQESWADFIVAYRQNGPYTGAEAGQLGVGGALDFNRTASYTFTSVLDVVGNRTRVTPLNVDTPVVLETPFPDVAIVMGSFLPILMENCAVNTAPSIPGRINVNQASRTVLLGIPGMQETFVEQILSERELEPADEGSEYRHETWLLTQGIVSLDEMKSLLPYVTAKGSVYRAQVVGYYDDMGPAARREVVFDTIDGTGRVLFWRDITHLGVGYSTETLGISAE